MPFVGESFSEITVNDLYEQYMEAKQYELRATSFDRKRRRLQAYVLPPLRNVRLDQLNIRVLQKWKIEISGQNLSEVTKRGIFAELRALLNYGVKMEYLVKNPLSSLGNFKDKDFTPAKDKLHYYTPEQFARFIDVAYRHAERKGKLIEWGYYVFFVIAYYTGMRKGEINALKWSDIEGNIINVRRSVSQKIKGTAIVETLPKNRTSYRSLQIPLPLIEVLDKHKARYVNAGFFSDDLRICGGERCLSDTSIENRNTRFAEEAGLPHIRIHDYRHSHASLLANEGINIKEISRRLGHANTEQTLNTYAHLYPREEERAVQVLNQVMIVR